MIIQRPSRPVHLTYCSNLHPIDGAQSLLALAEGFWPALARRLAEQHQEAEDGIDLGIWLPRQTAESFTAETEALTPLSEALNAFHGFVLTANAFPMGNFHAARVKEQVYLPDWQDKSRASYTGQVAACLASLPSRCKTLSLSTLPGSFKAFPGVDRQKIAFNLAFIARYFSVLSQASGVRFVLGVEPEPGCVFETTDEWIRFFKDELLMHHAEDEESIRNHIGMCFDCCHQAIQFEDPAESLAKLRKAGMFLAKMQLSSAIEIEKPADNEEALQHLGGFAEDRYLHQVVARSDAGTLTAFRDLPEYLAVARERNDSLARIHFHVPVFLDRCGPLGTTRATLAETLRETLAHDMCEHFEIETYSWGVMPERRGTACSEAEMLEDVLREYDWVMTQIAGI